MTGKGITHPRGMKKPHGVVGKAGPMWLVRYRRVNNTTVEILAVLPYGVKAERLPGVRGILVRAQDELDAMQVAIKELDWLRL